MRKRIAIRVGISGGICSVTMCSSMLATLRTLWPSGAMADVDAVDVFVALRSLWGRRVCSRCRAQSRAQFSMFGKRKLSPLFHIAGKGRIDLLDG